MCSSGEREGQCDHPKWFVVVVSTPLTGPGRPQDHSRANPGSSDPEVRPSVEQTSCLGTTDTKDELRIWFGDNGVPLTIPSTRAPGSPVD